MESKKIPVLLILCLCIFSLQGNAQYTFDTITLQKYNSAGTYLKSYLTDTRDIAISPLRWKKKDWLIVGSAVAVGTLVYVFDDEIRGVFQSNRSGFTNSVSNNFLEPFGSGLYSLPLFAGLFLHGEFSDNDKSKTVALDALKTYVLTAGMVTIMKQLFKRHRPFHDQIPDSKQWEGPFGDSKYTSFPSGHTMTAFALASYVSSAYRDKKWVGIASYTIAGLVGLSRINDDEHWASDVFIGGVIGYAVGKCVYNNSLKRYNIKIIPVSFAGLGLTIVKAL
jgi:membrane-associated phospholipid phosphatase